MKFDLTAAKAYVGAMFAGAGIPISNTIVGLFEATTGIDVPASLEALLASSVAAALGYIAVYFTPNKTAA